MRVRNALGRESQHPGDHHDGYPVYGKVVKPAAKAPRAEVRLQKPQPEYQGKAHAKGKISGKPGVPHRHNHERVELARKDRVGRTLICLIHRDTTALIAGGGRLGDDRY